jgi:2'-5' RNA ligase
MLHHAVVAFPRLQAQDAAWIESVRRTNDPQHRLIAAHITLVFPLVMPEGALDGHVRRCAAERSPFSITLDRAVVHRNAGAPNPHVFLLPAHGAEEIARLHDDLYGGALRAHLREDIPYVPHVTVGACPEERTCAALAAELNQRGISVHARIDAVEVVSVSADAVTRVAAFALGDSR